MRKTQSRHRRPQREGGRPVKTFGRAHHTNNGVGVRTNLITQNNQFINRRTGNTIAANQPYHIHPEGGAMAGTTHYTNPSVGGTRGHDYYDPMDDNGNQTNWKPPRWSRGRRKSRGKRRGRSK